MDDNNLLLQQLWQLIENECRHGSYWGGAGDVIKVEDLVDVVAIFDPERAKAYTRALEHDGGEG